MQGDRVGGQEITGGVGQGDARRAHEDPAARVHPEFVGVDRKAQRGGLGEQAVDGKAGQAQTAVGEDAQLEGERGGERAEKRDPEGPAEEAEKKSEDGPRHGASGA